MTIKCPTTILSHHPGGVPVHESMNQWLKDMSIYLYTGGGQNLWENVGEISKHFMTYLRGRGYLLLVVFVDLKLIFVTGTLSGNHPQVSNSNILKPSWKVFVFSDITLFLSYVLKLPPLHPINFTLRVPCWIYAVWIQLGLTLYADRVLFDLLRSSTLAYFCKPSSRNKWISYLIKFSHFFGRGIMKWTTSIDPTPPTSQSIQLLQSWEVTALQCHQTLGTSHKNSHCLH